MHSLKAGASTWCSKRKLGLEKKLHHCKVLSESTRSALYKNCIHSILVSEMMSNERFDWVRFNYWATCDQLDADIAKPVSRVVGALRQYRWP